MTYKINCVTVSNGIIQNISYISNQSTIEYTISKKDFIGMILSDSTSKPLVFTKYGKSVHLINNKYLSTEPNDTIDNLNEVLGR